jgi:hypothetical protein
VARVPERDVEVIRRFCQSRTPAHLRDEMRLDVDVRGTSVTISDSRPLWQGAPGEWMSMKIAQLRYEPDAALWTLYWADRNSRWHRYDDLEPTSNLDDVLAEVDEDPTCIFWG